MAQIVPYRLLFLGLILLLSACNPTIVTPTAVPSEYALRISYSPDTRPSLPALKLCAADQPGLVLMADEIPVTIMGSYGSELWLRVGIPDNWGGHAFQLANEQISVVINPENPTGSLNLDEILAIFTGQIQAWSELGGPDQSIQVWVLSPGDEARQMVDQNLLSNHSITDQAFLAASPRRMLEAIAYDPNAIGYLPRAWTDSTVKEVPLPINQQAALTQPLLALSNSQPDEQLRVFLACMQSGTGQRTLETLYRP